MKGGREKLGMPSIDWLKHATGRKPRKTVGFGSFDKKEKEWDDETYIRELPLIQGGIGAAIWDAAVFMTRWIRMAHEGNVESLTPAEAPLNGPWVGKTVLELGAGCGLPGVYAARYAKQVILTDYTPQLLENLDYNVGLNGDVESVSGDGNGDDDDEDHQGNWYGPMKHQWVRQARRRWRARVGAAAIVRYLNWDEIDSVEIPGEVQSKSSTETSGEVLTSTTTGATGGASIDGGHGSSSSSSGTALADLAPETPLAIAPPRALPETMFDSEEPIQDHWLIPVPQAEVIIGAELTYSLLSVKTLAKVISRFLAPGGVFYEILSDDRDGVNAFLEEISKYGFSYAANVVPESLRWETGTGQRSETYKFYTFWRTAEHDPETVLQMK